MNYFQNLIVFVNNFKNKFNIYLYLTQFDVIWSTQTTIKILSTNIKFLLDQKIYIKKHQKHSTDHPSSTTSNKNPTTRTQQPINQLQNRNDHSNHFNTQSPSQLTGKLDRQLPFRYLHEDHSRSKLFWCWSREDDGNNRRRAAEPDAFRCTCMQFAIHYLYAMIVALNGTSSVFVFMVSDSQYVGHMVNYNVLELAVGCRVTFFVVCNSGMSDWSLLLSLGCAVILMSYDIWML